MQFKFKVTEDDKPAPINAPMSVALTEEMKNEIQAIKRSSEQNRRLLSHLTRQFFAQVIEKYNAGEFEEVTSA